MSGIRAVIRLSRPANLVIMGLTMYALRYLVMAPIVSRMSLGMELQLSGFFFFLSCLVVVCLAGAGNMINDYFDRKVDKINKPDKLIVGKLVKRRIAMILHQTLNIAAFLLTVFLVWRTGQWVAIVFPVVIATLLWWYSPVLKKQPFTGNLVVALMVGIIPVWTGIFEIPLLRAAYSDMMVDPSPLFTELWSWLAVYSFFAFVLTLAREGVKDVEDIEGDTIGGYRTLPIIWGTEKTMRYISILLVTAIALVIGLSFWMFNPLESNGRFTFLMSMVCVALPLLLSLWLTRQAQTKEDYHRVSTWIKLSMAGGILFAFFAREWIL